MAEDVMERRTAVLQSHSHYLSYKEEDMTTPTVL